MSAERHGKTDPQGAHRRRHLTSPGAGRGVVDSGALGWAGVVAEVLVGEFSGKGETGVCFLIRFLAAAVTGRRSAWTGLGTNRGVENTPDVSERTEMVCGW
jgi:hypothetical protein